MIYTGFMIGKLEKDRTMTLDALISSDKHERQSRRWFM